MIFKMLEIVKHFLIRPVMRFHVVTAATLSLGV